MLTKSTLSVAPASRLVSFTVLNSRRLALVGLIFLMCSTGAMAQGRKYGLFVGINEYTFKGGKLSGAVNDAKNLRGEMLKDFGFNERDTTLLTDAAATRTAIIEGIRSYQSRVNKGDLFLFTYSGHGTVFPDASSSVIDEQKEFSMDLLLPSGRYQIPLGTYDSAIVPIDSSRNEGSRAWKNLILDDEFYDLFSVFATKGAQVIFISDSCHSGSIGKGPDGSARAKLVSPLLALNLKSLDEVKAAKPPAQKKLAPRSKWGAYIILAASKDNELSLDEGDDANAGGLFTKAVISELNKAEEPLTYADLITKVQPTVVNLARQSGIQQTPQVDARFGNLGAIVFSVQTKPAR